MSAAPTLERAAAVEPLGDPAEALARRLYETHSRLVLKYCVRRLRSVDDAEDAAQTTFVYALRALRRGVVPDAESAWLLTIARNVCHERWNAARRRQEIEATHDPQTLQEVAPAVAGSHGDAAALREALAALTEQQRRAVVLREWHGLPYREIEAALGLSQPATEALLFRARRSLAAALGGTEANGKRLRVLDLGSLLAGLKPLLGGASAVKLAGLVAATGAAVAVSTGVAGLNASDAEQPTPPVVAGSADGDGDAPSFTEAVAATFPRAVTPPATPRPRVPPQRGAKIGLTTDGSNHDANDDPGSTSDPMSGSTTDGITGTTSAVTDAVDDTIATVEGAASTLPAVPDTSTVLPAIEVPSVDLPAIPLPYEQGGGAGTPPPAFN